MDKEGEDIGRGLVIKRLIMKPSWPFGPQRRMKMQYRQGLKSQIPNSKQCLVFDAWDLEFKEKELAKKKSSCLQIKGYFHMKV